MAVVDFMFRIQQLPPDDMLLTTCPKCQHNFPLQSLCCQQEPLVVSATLHLPPSSSATMTVSSQRVQVGMTGGGLVQDNSDSFILQKGITSSSGGKLVVNCHSPEPSPSVPIAFVIPSTPARAWTFPPPETDLERLSSTMKALRSSGWYYEGLSWQESAALLTPTSPGTFLVRDSSDPRFLFSLSVQTDRGPTSVRLHYHHATLPIHPHLAAIDIPLTRPTIIWPVVGTECEMSAENGYLWKKDSHYSTKAIHVGSEAEQWTSMSVVPPISLSTTFKQEAPAQFKQFEYSRSGNPNRACLERCLASLDDAKHGLCFSSGLGATTAISSMLSAGDHLLSVDDIYGGTSRFFRNVAERFKITTTFACGTDAEKFCSNLQPNTRMVWVESPTNPLLMVMDIPRIASLIKAYNKDILLVVDNTFLTSYFQKPLALGADIAVYSVTKYINGHSDVVMGAATLNNTELFEKLKYLQNAMGIVPSAFDCYLVMRSLKTLKLRMDQHMKNSLAVGVFLESHPLVEKVMHPGLPSHPQHDVARRLWSGCSGMVSFYIKGGLDEAREFLKALKVITLAESLGGYESLADHPELMTHASIPEDIRKQLGITGNLIRLSVGLESTEDLVNDLNQALQASKTLKTL